MDRFPRRGLPLRGIPALLVGGVAVGLLLVLAGAVGRARAAARNVPISPVTADRYVGADFVERSGLATGDRVAGELDDVSVLASDSFDPDALDPAVRAFYERTGSYELRYRTTWHRPFRAGAWLARRLTRRIEQLNLPGPGDGSWHRLESRFLAVSEPSPPESSPDVPAREDVRAWVRTDPETGDAVFVALYATHRRGDERLVNIAAPLPGGNVSTVLRPEALDGADGSLSGGRLTTARDGGGDGARRDAGLYLRTPLGPLRLPAGQEFRVWRVDDDDGGNESEAAVGGGKGGGQGESEGKDEGEGEQDDRVRGDWSPTLGAVHEMWLFGRRFLTVDYEIRGAADAGEVSERTSESAASEATAESGVGDDGAQTSSSTS